MVFKKRLEYSFNGYQVPAMPQIPKSAKVFVFGHKPFAWISLPFRNGFW